ncbi:MAG TPA: apolipoprotein N-acyltransferase [Prolixibacteraceae bacterium]|jgi:apolipoprotein N-acyltransferase|nr:apolipoprotein N-acyltransferase [Prolixibacteraceae bacterium]
MIRKKQLFLSVISGVLLSLPWSSSSFSWTLFFAFVPLLMVEDQLVSQKQSQRSIVLFFYAIVTFLVWNVLSTWWIAYVSLGGMILITGINAFLMACVWWLMHLIRRRFALPTGYFSWIVLWLTFEYLHFHWAIQWPWLTLGNGLANSVQLIQWYEFTGVLGGSLWVLLINILLFSLYKCFTQKRVNRSLQLSALTVLLVAGPVCWSLHRYATYTEKGKAVEIALLQPNINPYSEKFSAISSKVQTHRLISLVQTIVTDSTQYVLAPETALASMWEEENLKQNKALEAIDSLIIQYPKIRFVAGAITQKRLGANESISYTSRKTADGNPYEVFNSSLLMDQSLQVQIGHKSILVSGVEKMPFEQYFSFLGDNALQVGGISGSLSSANESTVFEGDHGDKIGSVICFESAFGEYVASAVKKGASLIFIMTNDSWWKDSPGITQHFSFSRLRAIETRRSIARSANTGISGFINQRGDVLKKTEINSCIAILSRIQMNNEITFYVTYGDYLGRVSCYLSGLILIYLLIGYLRNRGDGL